ncbi:MAG TPA: alanine dehydrogenase, partial [Bacteroidia bacterium]|nr:alanine dehydrogenase [Bacteroidia bacterium]
MKKIKVAIIREGKVPHDKRSPFTPEQCFRILEDYKNVELVVQPSEWRSFKDSEFTDYGIPLQEDLSDCDILMGVKEVPMQELIPGKKYFFFSHTIKKQPHNRELLKA